MKLWRFKLYVAWYDGWFGYYYDRRHKHLYLQPFFWLGLRINFGSKR
jgi:hypothetical protein